MINIFFIKNVLDVDRQFEVQTKSGQNLLMPETTPRFSKNIKLLEHAKKYNRPVVLRVENGNIMRVMHCEQGHVMQIAEDENGGFKITFLPQAGVYKLHKEKRQTLQLIKNAKRSKKPIWFGVYINNILLVKLVEDE